MRRLVIMFAVFCCVHLPGYATTPDESWAAYQHGDYPKALAIFLKLASQGNPVAQFNLGVMYKNGQGVPQDAGEAEKWYRLAAEQGYAPAQNNLGTIYEEGQGVPQDAREAVKWYSLAAEQGVAVAQNNLGVMYDNGQGVPKDDREAAKWYRLAAAQDEATAQGALGDLYRHGRGVPKDRVVAYALYHVAATNDDTYRGTTVSQLTSLMTAQEINAAQKLVHEIAQSGHLI